MASFCPGLSLIGTARLAGAAAAMLQAARMSSVRSRMARWRGVSGRTLGSGLMLSSATSSPTLNCLNACDDDVDADVRGLATWAPPGNHPVH